MTIAASPKDLRATLRFCACCPNPCRRAIPAQLPAQRETDTPSALAMIALAVIDKQLTLDASVRRALSRTEAARACRAACPYGHDIAGAVETLLGDEGSTR